MVGSMYGIRWEGSIGSGGGYPIVEAVAKMSSNRATATRATFMWIASDTDYYTAIIQASASDPAGSMNGKVAVNVVPVSATPDGEPKPLPTAGCVVHLVNAEEQITPWNYPCGDWFQPPVGRYLFWVEQGSTVRFQSILPTQANRSRVRASCSSGFRPAA